MELLLDVGLDIKLVQALASLLSAHLLDGSQERVRLVESVKEADSFVDDGGVILPHIEHLKTLLHVIEPGVKTTSRHPRLLGPLSRNSVELDIFHEALHRGSHGQLSLERQLKVLEISAHLLNERVDQFALLEIDVLVRATLLIGQLRVDFFDGELLTVDLDLFEHTDGELLGNVDDGGGTLISRATALGLELDQNQEQVLALSGSEINLSIGMHTESERSFWGKLVLDVLEVLVVVLRNGALEAGTALSVREELSLVEELIVEQVLEIGSAQDSIPIVDNMTAIHDFTNQVLKIIPRNLS